MFPNNAKVEVLAVDLVPCAGLSFAWTFVDRFAPAIALNAAAPPGVFDHKVMAYIAPRPLDSDDGARTGHRWRSSGH